jgi:hypothetical protein
MALHWRPVGPEPASTYWQRRAVLAAAVVLLLALLVSLLGGGGDEPDRLAGEAAPSAAPSTGPSTTGPATSATPSASPSAAAVPICQPDALKVEALASEERFAVGSSPRLSLRVTNTGATPCTRDLGQAAVELVVLSGSDRIWSSDDCAPGGKKDVTTLQPAKPVVQRVTWNGRRSRPGCAGDKDRAQAGTYRVNARVGQLKVEGDVFRLGDD